MPTTTLRSFCHSRSGDKGDDATMSLIAFRPEDYSLIEREVTEEAVRSWFGDQLSGSVTRYELPKLGALSFFLQGILRGGATAAMHRDIHGKALSGAFLDMTIEVPADFEPPVGPF